MRYLQLAHNQWDADTCTSRPQVLHSFGRENRLAIEGLVASLPKLLDLAATLRATSGSELTFLGSPDGRRPCPGRSVAPDRDRHRDEEAPQGSASGTRRGGRTVVRHWGRGRTEAPSI
ncbi:hypothetical protein GCM10022295_92510 [Streptomyces osmaniensis]|uniref:Uncharacterized protein n=1 Tax=Streptomyces osmaniensis TaxID=593134 RepID=A0ABP6Z8N5_9ACTN